METNIQEQIFKIRSELVKIAKCHEEDTHCDFDIAVHPEIFLGDSPKEIVIGLIVDGKPQGFVFFVDGVVTRTEEGNDRNYFEGVKTLEEVFEVIFEACFSAENISAAKAICQFGRM